ncbi:hypothetical protein PV325_003367 [Microctonus aethiopoides]|nr:hypothetical protein PV325_003367 [Microctonus aethiopoides]
MNIIIPILLYQFVLFEKVWSIDSYEDISEKESPKVYHHESLPLSHVKIKIENEDLSKSPKQVNLKLTERALANENLPVWIASGVIHANDLLYENSNDLRRNYVVMMQVGKFSTYQQTETSSAAVYFHKRHEFDGMIDTRVIIRGLSVEFINPDGISSIKLGENGLYRDPEHQNHALTEQEITPGPDSGLNNENSRLRTYKDRIFDGYPEILVVVDWSTAQDWDSNMIRFKSNSERKFQHGKSKELDLYSTIVSHVITLFNGVDMLYSKLQNTKIQINIAGIVIGSAKNTFTFLEKCFLKNQFAKKSIDADCAMAKFQSYFKAREGIIQIGSYDFIVYLTSDNVFFVDHGKWGKKYSAIEGLARHYHDFYEKYMKEGENVKPTAIIHDKGFFKSFANVAHEIGHMMSVYHDTPLYLTKDGKCCGYIMKLHPRRCIKCLSWSPTSEETLRLFFSSPNCCALINKPRSLLPPGPYETLTSNEQCQCYGYKSATMFAKVFHNFCESRLKCQRGIWKSFETVIPMDGTLCGNKKVCWNKKCEEIDVS